MSDTCNHVGYVGFGIGVPFDNTRLVLYHTISLSSGIGGGNKVVLKGVIRIVHTSSYILRRV